MEGRRAPGAAVRANRWIGRTLLSLGCCLGSTSVWAGENQWTRVGPDGATSIAIDPSAPSTVYFGVYGGVARSTDAGATWLLSGDGLEGLVSLVALDPVTPSTLFAVVPGSSSFTGDPKSGIYRSTDAGATWARVYGPIGSGSRFGKVVALAATPSAVLAGVKSFTCVFDLCFTSGSTAISRDGGTSWAAGGEFIASSFSADPAEAATVYAGATAGASLSGGAPLGGVFRSSDGGGVWQGSAGEVAGKNVLSVAVDPINSRVVYAGAADSGLYKTSDAGSSWASARDGLSQTRISALAVDPVQPSVVYAGTDGGVFSSANGGASWRSVGLNGSSANQLAFDPGDHNRLYAVTGEGAYAITFASTPCEPSSTSLCLGGQFRVEVAWRSSDGRSGSGRARPGTADTGYFWFFDSGNVELAIKILDGRPINGHFWLFSGALSDVEYTITATDTTTGEMRSYHNASGQLSSFADTSAFSGAGGSAVQSIVGSATVPISTAAYLGRSEACAAGPTRFCVNGGRFQVDATWRTRDGRSGAGRAAPLTADTGYFWFFGEDNVELVLKVLDGRSFNGHYWVFYGALSDVAYTITVTDTETGVVKTYENPQGTLASHADTEAF